jgi:hypothetical protein
VQTIRRRQVEQSSQTEKPKPVDPEIKRRALQLILKWVRIWRFRRSYMIFEQTVTMDQFLFTEYYSYKN